MKISPKIFLPLFLLFLLSCEKEPQKQVLHPEWYWGEVMAIKNEICWVAEPYAVESENSISSRTTIFMSVFDETGYQRQKLTLVRVPKSVGTYPLYTYSYFERSDTTGAYLLFTDGDIVTDSYLLVEETPGNQVTIISFEEDSREMQGTFDITLALDPRKPRNNPNAPDTLHFRKGTFHTRIKE